MKRNVTAISSLLLLGGLGSLGYLATRMRKLNLFFHLRDGEDLDFC